MLQEVRLYECDYISYLAGLWDVVSDEEAVSLILVEYLKIGGPFQHAAQLLVRSSCMRAVCSVSN